MGGGGGGGNCEETGRGQVTQFTTCKVWDAYVHRPMSAHCKEARPIFGVERPSVEKEEYSEAKRKTDEREREGDMTCFDIAECTDTGLWLKCVLDRDLIACEFAIAVSIDHDGEFAVKMLMEIVTGRDKECFTHSRDKSAGETVGSGYQMVDTIVVDINQINDGIVDDRGQIADKSWLTEIKLLMKSWLTEIKLVMKSWLAEINCS